MATFPYIWNEIKFNIGYESDLQFIPETMQRIVAEELGAEMLQRVGQYRELLAQLRWMSWKCASIRGWSSG